MSHVISISLCLVVVALQKYIGVPIHTLYYIMENFCLRGSVCVHVTVIMISGLLEYVLWVKIVMSFYFIDAGITFSASCLRACEQGDDS